MEGNVIKFIKRFLKERFIQVKANNILPEKTKIVNGVPQGSVLSVTLFLIAINYITVNVTSPIKGCLFADDYTIFCSEKSPQITQQLLQNILSKLQTWAENTGFKLSPSKT